VIIPGRGHSLWKACAKGVSDTSCRCHHLSCCLRVLQRYVDYALISTSVAATSEVSTAALLMLLLVTLRS
jgi:hypothetical protein